MFRRKDLRARKKRIRQVVDGEVTGKAAKEAIDAMQAAIMAACIVPVITSTAVTAGR